MNIQPSTFQQLILSWFDQHGRKHLPWQQNKTPYRVWISEIMLQQTQVNTVIPYFKQFIKHFPDLKTLAAVKEDKVLHLWAGLGYYSRARNLHRTAKKIMDEFDGCFPNTLETLQSLPGIGRSTAGAILSLAYNQPAAILDGNVKRVLARFHAMTQVITEKQTLAALWKKAESYMPPQRAADYTQAMMDLGATLCTRSNPVCTACPLHLYCSARQQGIAHLLPARKTSRKLPVRTTTFLLLQKRGRLLLLKRPPVGIWGGLWSFPEMDGKPEMTAIRQYCRQHFRVTVSTRQLLEPFRHTFSHYHLDIYPVLISLARAPAAMMEADRQIWYNPQEPSAIGLPKPIQFMIKRLT